MSCALSQLTSSLLSPLSPELDPLIRVKACLKSVYDLTDDHERLLASNQACLEYLKTTSQNKDLLKVI